MAHRIYDWRLLRTGKYACLQPMPVGMFYALYVSLRLKEYVL